MKEKVRKSSLEYAFLFLVSIFIFHTDVLAYEMELGQRTEDETEEDIAHFDVHVSKVWTSKGKELLSYDVSESGKILISFPDRKVGVFDENMVFLFELSFHSSGSYGAIWNGENILLVDVRYPAAVECGMDGRAAGSYAVPDDCYSKAVITRLRKCGAYEYYCSNNGRDGNSVVNYMYYTVLKRTSETNGEEIIYESDKMMGGDWYGICILLSFAAVGIGMFGWMTVVVYQCVKAMGGKPFNGTRTYSTAYSVDDCIGLLSRKNIYDVLRYSFRQDKENTAELTVTGHAKYTCPQIKACHQMVFEENGNTKISITNLPCSKPFPFPYVPQWWMDEFMEQKLDALPIDTKPENMGAGQF